ncbi:MAG: hypothetical protein WEA36_00005 [Balneolaceae bacterium]
MFLRRINLRVVAIICFPISILFFLAVECGTANEENGEEVIFRAFNLEESESNVLLTQVGEDGEELPFPLVSGVSYIENNDQEDRGVVLALMPYNSEGTPIDPGPGWLQIKFNPEESNTVLQAEQISSSAYLYLSEVPDLGTFQALYFDEDANNVPVDGTILVNQFDFSLGEEYSSLDLDLEIDELEIGESDPVSVNGLVEYSAESFTRNENSSSENEPSPDVPGGCSEYSGPTGDLQWETLCRSAHQYACAGQQDGVKATCANIDGLRNLYPNIPECPYCD